MKRLCYVIFAVACVLAPSSLIHAQTGEEISVACQPVCTGWVDVFFSEMMRLEKVTVILTTKGLQIHYSGTAESGLSFEDDLLFTRAILQNSGKPGAPAPHTRKFCIRRIRRVCAIGPYRPLADSILICEWVEREEK